MTNSLTHSAANTALSELEQRAIALGERFAASKELGQALAAHFEQDAGSAPDSPERAEARQRTADLIEKLHAQPFALSRAFNDL